jgi:hypothetical protein
MVLKIARTGFLVPTGKNYITPVEIILWVVHMPEYYDYVLGFVPLALVGITAVLHAVGVDLLVAVPVGATTAGLAVGHALFVNGPVADRSDTLVDDAPARSSSTSVTDRSPINAD